MRTIEGSSSHATQGGHALQPIDDLSFLVVEDHDFQRRGIVRLLEGLDALKVHAASDGMSALELIRDNAVSVDIVICDLSMPRMDGFEFARHLSGRHRSLSLILLSSHDPTLLASIADLTRAYPVHLLGAISKPLTALKLAPMIELHRGRPSAPYFDKS